MTFQQNIVFQEYIFVKRPQITKRQVRIPYQKFNASFVCGSDLMLRSSRRRQIKNHFHPSDRYVMGGFSTPPGSAATHEPPKISN
ncbi:hypothetical protein AAFO90_10695 [Phaeobacter sp. CAU 1743]